MKKMRRLIPAIAMLLVSAVMLSTASFAWFTMSENASATGMQVQAKASGSLVIDSKPLNDASKLTSVALSSDAHVLTPITLKSITGNDNTTWQWQKPKDGNLVDSNTGLAADKDATGAVSGLIATDPVEDQDYFEEIIYLGSAGEELKNQKLTITLKAPIASTGEAVKAYSAAIYVSTVTSWNSAEPSASDITLTTAPTHILHVDDYDENGADTEGGERNTITLTGTDGKGYTIPSVVGVQNDNYVGLRVVIRVFIDGDLRSPNKKTVTPMEYKTVAQDATFAADTVYYVQANGVWGLANLSGYEVGDDLPDTWATYEEGTPIESEYNYINSKDVPVTGSTLQLDFKVAEIPQNNNP